MTRTHPIAVGAHGPNAAFGTHSHKADVELRGSELVDRSRSHLRRACTRRNSPADDNGNMVVLGKGRGLEESSFGSHRFVIVDELLNALDLEVKPS